MPSSLVTGGAGFIGSNLVQGLLREGHRVTVLDNLSTSNGANLEDIRAHIEFIQGDIRDGDSVRRAMAGVDYVFHQAAIPSVPRSISDPWQSHDNNVNGTLNVLLTAKECEIERVVYAASSSAYGDSLILPKVESMPAAPLSPYAVTKYVGELYCHVFSHVFGLETVALRYFNVFGPRQDPNSPYAAVVPKFICALCNGVAPTINGDGNQTRDFAYIDDVVEANLAAARAPREKVAGQVFNIGGGDRLSINELVQWIQDIMGTNINPMFAQASPGDVRDSQADITRAQAAFGYAPVVGLKEGLRRTVEWFRNAPHQTLAVKGETA